MNLWAEHIPNHFTAGISLLWVVSDPDNVLLDETLLTTLRNRGFELMQYEDPFAFRVEYEERYRAAWDRGEEGPTPALILHLRSADANALPWDIVHNGRIVQLSLADLLPKLSYSVVQHVEPSDLAKLFEAHQTELQTTRSEKESKDFILEYVYELTPRSIRKPEDFWRELLRMHGANRSLPAPFAKHVASILQGKGLLSTQPVATWLMSRSAMLATVQDAWYRYLKSLGLDGTRVTEPAPTFDIPKTDIPFDDSDIQTRVDSMFLDGSLHPLAVHHIPQVLPPWIKAGIVKDPAAAAALVLNGINKLIDTTPMASSSYKEWGEFAKRHGETLARLHELEISSNQTVSPAIQNRLITLQDKTDEALQAWVGAQRYADLILQPVTKGPVMVHHIPRFLHHRRLAGETKQALLVFDGLALDQWVQVREHLIKQAKQFAFDEATTFAWLPTVTSVSRQALFSGLKPREFEDSISRTDKEESLWKRFWQNEGVSPQQVMYRRALHHAEQLPSLAADIDNQRPAVIGLVVDEVDARTHKEHTKKDVAMWVQHWLSTGFVSRLFSLLLTRGYHIYLTADHGNVESTGIGRPNQGVLAETRGERVRVYRSEPLLDSSATEYPSTLRLNIAGLPKNFMPLFAAKRSAFVPDGERVVVHGGVSIEELIVPFVKVSYAAGTE